MMKVWSDFEKCLPALPDISVDVDQVAAEYELQGTTTVLSKL